MWHANCFIFHAGKGTGNMINGIEIMANAAIRQISRLNCVTHNIANVNTPGFKAESFQGLRSIRTENWLHRPEIMSLAEVEKLSLRGATSG
jgi:flagellar basal body rod protein FlgF